MPRADRVLGFAVGNLAHPMAPPFELDWQLRVAAFVHHIIDLAAEGVQRGDSLTALSGGRNMKL